MAAKDRRWTVDLASFEGFAYVVDSDRHTLRGIKNDREGAHVIVRTHNADIDALEAENAKLRAVVEVACGGPVSRKTLGLLVDALRRTYGNEFGKGRMWDIVEALEALVPEEAADE